MRKTSALAAEAFMRGDRFRMGNTKVIPSKGAANKSVALVLHGNVIARRYTDTGLVVITLAGWQSNVTKERLNALPGVQVQYKGGKRKEHTGQAYLNGVPWDGKMTKVALE